MLCHNSLVSTSKLMVQESGVGVEQEGEKGGSQIGCDHQIKHVTNIVNDALTLWQLFGFCIFWGITLLLV